MNNSVSLAEPTTGLSRMSVITTLSQSIFPKGTTKRLVALHGLAIIIQALACMLPGLLLHGFPPNETAMMIVTVVVGIIAVLMPAKKSTQGHFVLPFVGMLLTTLLIVYGLTHQGAMLYLIVWGMLAWFGERKGYLTIGYMLILLVWMLFAIAFSMLLMPEKTFVQSEIMSCLVGGLLLGFFTVLLIYREHGRQENYYKESKQVYEDMVMLSNKMSDIFTTEQSLTSVLWRVSQECIPLLGLEDCVIYLYDKDRKVLVQMAAYGKKTPQGSEIVLSPIEIAPNKGVVGQCFADGETKLIHDLSQFQDYIVDDAARQSELAIPIFSSNRIVGVIDSEHSEIAFFQDRHVKALEIIATFCGIKIMEENAKESLKN